MTKDFAEIEKEQLNVYLPVDLSTQVRRRAADRRWSIARTVTEALSIGMDLDPATFGIKTDKQTA